MKILFIGGSGIISQAASACAVEHGADLWLLNRGHHAVPAGAKTLVADLTDAAATRAALAGHDWDVVVQWIAFTPPDLERDIELFRGRTRQYLFISSASAYQKPVAHYRVTESTPLINPYWEYSRSKIACETVLQRAFESEGFPGTIVRPSLTYGDNQVPLVLNSWRQSWTAVDRMRRGLPLIIPGDGTSLWTITHNTDFARGLIGLLGNPAAIGQAFHITTDEVLTWNQYFALTAEAAGVSVPKFIHIASDYLTACLPSTTGTLLGDKAVSVVFDNTKIKQFVPGFTARMTFQAGIRRTIAWFDAVAERRQVDPALNATWDQLIAGYERGLQAARNDFAP